MFIDEVVSAARKNETGRGAITHCGRLAGKLPE